MSEQDVRAYACEKRFSAGTLERWLGKSREEREALLELVVRLRLGENHFRDVLDALDAIACRRDSGLKGVLGSEAVTAVFSRRLGRNETIKALKQVLRRLRYPQLSEIEGRLAAFVRDMRLPSGVSVDFPENLEGEQVSITLRAKSADELRSEAAALLDAAAGAELDEIFRLLEGEW